MSSTLRSRRPEKLITSATPALPRSRGRCSSRPDFSMGWAEQRFTRAERDVCTPFPPVWRSVLLESVHGRRVAELRALLLRINAAAALLLVFVCTNVAVLIVLRAFRRQNEMAVRVALG